MPHKDKSFKYEPLQFYPHLGPKDAHIWNKFVLKNPLRFDRVIYDMRCGEVEDPEPGLPQNIRDAWIDLCRGRIDVVAEDEDAIYIIEIKPRARGEAMGQAEYNAVLYRHEHRGGKRVIPAVVTDFALLSTKFVYAQENVLLLLA